MLAASWVTVRDRWQLFIGAIVTVAMAVALTQSSLLALVSAATANAPAHLPEIERLAIDEGYVAAVALLGVVVGLAFFVSIFIVSSTFAFAVAQRRRDMALLRLIGAARGQVRRLLLRESLIVGGLGAAIGVPLGVLAARAQDRLLIGLALVPDGFRTDWRTWIVFVSAGVGIVVSALAAWSAATRAGRVRPLEALRGSLRADRVMNAWRWAIGLLAFAGATAMIIVAPLVGIEGGLALAINACLVLVLGLAAWSPVIVPPLAAVGSFLARLVVPRSPLRDLVGGNVRTAVRRTASTATPIVMLVGLVVGLGSALAATQDGMRIEAAARSTSDVIVVADDDLTDEIAAMPGVDGVSTSTETIVRVMAADDGDGELRETAIVARSIDPDTFLTMYDLEADRGSFRSAHDGASVLTPDLAGAMQVGVGDATTITVGGTGHVVEVGAILPMELNPVGDLLVPHHVVAGAPVDALGTRETAITTDGPESAVALADRLSTSGIDARTTENAIEVLLDESDRQNRSIQIALLGLSALLTMVAIVNAVVVAGTDRRTEFATLRLTGLTRGQVLRAALAESTVVIMTGALLGLVAAGGTAITMSAVVTELVGERVVAVPWVLIGVVVGAIALVVWTVTALTAAAVTRVDPITVAGARE